MPVGQWQWVTLAEGFPPGVVTNRPETALKPNETPSATGISASSEGYIVGGSIPTAVTRVVKTYSVAGTTYEWHYSRMWAMDATTPDLHIGAPRYNATYFRQKTGEISFNEDTNKLIKMLPIGGTGLIVFKTTGAYIIPNANDLDGNWIRGDLMQECALADATYAVELDGIAYFLKDSGLYAVNIQGQVEELSVDVRGGVTAGALTTDYKNKYIIVGSTRVYDVMFKRWLVYDSTNFTFETRRIRASDQTTPLAVKGVGFDITWVAGTAEAAQATIEFATKEEDREWSETMSIVVTNQTGEHAFVKMAVPPHNCRDFKVKIITLPSTLKIKRVSIEVSGYTEESRAT